MRKNLRWRFALIGVVILLTLWYIYPTIRWATLDSAKRKSLMEQYRQWDLENPKPTLSEEAKTYLERWYQGDKTKALNLGLDLQGGMHLVLKVDADAAITNEMVRMKNNLRKYFIDNHIVVGSMSVDNQKILIPLSTSTREEVKKAINDYGAGQVSVSDSADNVVASLPEARITDVRTMSVKQALETMRNRIDEFGVAEPVIQREGEDRIVVQLPGIENPERVMELLGKTAQLGFHMVVDGPAPEAAILANYNQNLPKDTFLAPWRGHSSGGQQLYYLLEREAPVTGADLVDARIGRDESGMPAVNFQLSRTGGLAFGKLTEANLYKFLAIVLDNVVESAPRINSKITTNGQITGQFTLQEAEDLAIVLRSGALPAPVKIIEQRTVGPTLGIESIKYGVRSVAISFIVVAAFMVFYYRFSGGLADFGLVMNILMLFAFLAYFRATLTLPGIGGIVLTIGMSVDANVLIFERIREELEKGKTLRAAIEQGYSKAFLTIFDSHVTTLITALVLFMFGTGPVKGFAVTLSAGIIISLYTALFVTRSIFDFLTDRKWLTKLKMLHVFTNPRVPFVRIRYWAIGGSLVLITIGMVIFGLRGRENFGIDFNQGTIVQVRFQNPSTTQEVREALTRGGIVDPTVQQFADPRDFLIRTAGQTPAAQSSDEKETAALVGKRIEDILRQNIVNNPFEVERTEEVGATVSADLRTKALLAILYSAIGILVYVGFRFDFQFGFGGVVALFHDILITLGALALTGRQIQLPVVAALLTIFGYSINDTIVVFDRIRENMKLRRGQDFGKLIDTSINETLSRTIITSLTVIFSVVVLYFVGSEVTRDFSFALFVGIITGTYSSIFIATPVVYAWQQIFPSRRYRTAQVKTQKKLKKADELSRSVSPR